MPEQSVQTSNRPSTEYECHRCGQRVRGESHPGTCPDCGSRLQNLGVTRQL